MTSLLSQLQKRMTQLEAAVRRLISTATAGWVAAIAAHSAAANPHPNYLLVADIDDAPVNGEITAPISSNWAYDHLAAADPHAGYLTQTEGDALYSVLAHTHSYQPLDTQLTDVAGLAYATNATKVIAVKATEDGFELVTAGGGVSDHGGLTGLADDDHTQYHNDARGNALYSVLAHTHSYQPLDTQLTDVAALAYATNAAKVIAVKATEDGFELVVQSGGVTDHGALTGLADDDHAQYLLVSGVRAMTGTLDMGTNILDNATIIKLPEIADPGLASADEVWLHSEDVAGHSQLHFNNSTHKWTLAQDLWTVARNVTGVGMTAKQVVRVSGTTGARPQIALADADLHHSMFGMLPAAIADNGWGPVVTSGFVKSVDTSAWAAGTILYLSQTAGDLTSTEPTYPAYVVEVGVVIDQHASNGIIHVYQHEHPEAQIVGKIADHAAAADPHTGYRLESADHSHQSTGAQAGQLDHGLALTGLGDNDHPQYLLLTDIDDVPVDAETAAPISSNWAYDHVAAADPHTGYRLESADHTHQSTGAAGGTLDHGLALTGLTDDDHSAYLLASDATSRAAFAANWTDLTDAGNTTLHTHSIYALLTGGTFTGNITLGENASLDLDPSLSADGKYSGLCQTGTSAATLAFGELVYLNSSSLWALAKADAAATCTNKLGICVLAASGSAATKVLLIGNIRADALFDTFTVGAPVYISAATAGKTVTAAPTGTTNFVVRIVGYAEDANSIYFHPSDDWLTLV